MRFGVFLMVMLVSGSGLAFAQNSFSPTTTIQPYAAPQLYVAPGGVPTASPYFNTQAQPLPMEQMVAGRNAPSYDFNGSANTFTGFGSGTGNTGYVSGGIMTPEQAQLFNRQREAAALAAQNEYLASLQQQSQMQQQQQPQAAPMMMQQTQNFAAPFLGGQGQAAAPMRRRVLYREMNNPLATPPRLFNPDQ
jgi:hypothetical protein